MSSIVLLGSTGSIGVNTLIVAERYNITIEALAAGNNIDLLNKQISIHQPKMVAIANEADRDKVNHANVLCGTEGILALIEMSQSDTIVNALVGYTGLAPTIKATNLGKRVALANKESLVVAGEFINMSRITPIDSEHFGLWYLMNERPISKLYITASGGAFRDWELEKMKDATFSDALKHPNWSMGNKITIDSATMTNKLFELLEAKWLFDTSHVDAVIEKKSIIHALAEFTDGSTTAHFAGVDMKLPIAFALKGEVTDPILPPTDLLSIGALEFLPIEEERYPIWSIKEHILKNPHLGVIVNAANEEAIKAFQKEECSFFGMSEMLLDAYKKFEDIKAKDINEIIQIDKEVRSYAPQDKVLILHGWGGSDAPHWQAELAAEIAKNYGTVSFPLLDNCHFPSKNRWVNQVKTLLEEFKPDTVVCHSLANTLWFWLCQEEIPAIQRLFMVSPPSLSTRESTIKTFFPCKIPDSLHAKEVQIIVSDNDPWVQMEEAKELAKHYDIPLTVIKNAGHINADSGYGKWELIEKLVLGES